MLLSRSALRHSEPLSGVRAISAVTVKRPGPAQVVRQVTGEEIILSDRFPALSLRAIVPKLLHRI